MSTTTTAGPTREYAANVERALARLDLAADLDGTHDHEDDPESRFASNAVPPTPLEDVPPAVVRTHALAFEGNQERAPSGPTKTKTIQDDYSAEMYKRFRRVKGLVRETVAENDALGLGDSTPSRTALDANDLEVNESDPDWWFEYVAERRAGLLSANARPRDDFNFPDDDQKIDEFLEWLQGVEDDEVLEVTRRGGRVAGREAWQNIYVRRSYAKGVEFADARLREQGLTVPKEELAQMFNKPIHADALGILYTRNFQELKGITNAMDQEISRVLTQGFAEGHNPRKMARAINDRVDKIGLTRARTLARTETINAHSESTLNRYAELLGEDAKVTGAVEYSTAGDSRVCPLCAGLEGETYSLDEARGVIPLHPNCRCAWLPVVQRGSANSRLDLEAYDRAAATALARCT